MLRIDSNISWQSFKGARNGLILHNLSLTTRLTACRINYSFGFDLFRYCVFTDGFFNCVHCLLNNDCNIYTDTDCLKCLLKQRFRNCTNCILCADKTRTVDAVLACTRSCVQIDLLSFLPNLYKSLLIMATSPTGLFRIVELINRSSIAIGALIACPVGNVNTVLSKTKLLLCNFSFPLLVLRSKFGGISLAAALLNSFYI